VLAAKMLPWIFVAEAMRSMAPPAVAALLPEKVQLVTVTGPCAKMAPPSPEAPVPAALALLPANVLLVMVTAFAVALKLEMAPPSLWPKTASQATPPHVSLAPPAVLLAENVLLRIVAVAAAPLKTAPPEPLPGMPDSPPFPRAWLLARVLS
jgi:hypothetical protein